MVSGGHRQPAQPREAYRTVKDNDNACREESALCSPVQRYEHSYEHSYEHKLRGAKCALEALCTTESPLYYTPSEQRYVSAQARREGSGAADAGQQHGRLN